MKKHYAPHLAFVLFIVGLLAAFHTAHAALTGGVIPFGGRVLSTTVPDVTCTTTGGTAPVKIQPVTSGIGGLYTSLPLYTVGGLSLNGSTPQPKPGDWILGLQELMPDMTTCEKQEGDDSVPYPVSRTRYYSVSLPVWNK